MNDNNHRLHEIVSRLDRLRPVPTHLLMEIVTGKGMCMSLFTEDEPPELTGENTADRELAERL